MFSKIMIGPGEDDFDPADFARRHIGPSDSEVTEMLEQLGVESLAQLLDQTVPPAIRQTAPLELGPALSERDALAELRRLAGMNRMLTSLIGQGYYATNLPAVIQRNVLENPAWYTAYTPYQAEISQGRLEALLNFQTMVADLTGLEIANASLLDEATAAAEAMGMARRISKSNATAFFVERKCHPQTVAVVRTRAEPLGWEVLTGDAERDLDPAAVFGMLIQYPDTFGEVRDFRSVIARAHAAGAVVVMAADPLALTLLVPPGQLGADIAVGSTQRFGVPMGYGGPHAAYIATKPAHQRALPGRLVGVSVDRRGKAAYRLALQTREQHIRREKATSNICTAQVLPAIIASMYAVYHGAAGLRHIAKTIHRHTATLAAGLSARGWMVRPKRYFDTITVDVGQRQSEIVERGVALGINFRAATDGDGANVIGISCDELTTSPIVNAVWEAFGRRPQPGAGSVPNFDALREQSEPILPDALLRTDEILTHPVFHRYRSETEMLRYLRRLADRDLALDRCMIPLGSCTMKLNGTAEMVPLTWPEFGDLHPYVPDDQAAGYGVMMNELQQMLCAISGYDAVSLQPNSGAQGEYAGLLCIRAYHRSRGEGHRNVCLIPSSAHGTNPASAQLAGMKVVVVACDTQGNVDIADLRAKIGDASGHLAAIMVTYPSTHGVFEEEIATICDLVHAAGGQVYLDGANLNAQVGLSRPGDYGADVSHFNLHKTFCIPHGGGGPGMGPIGVKRHLVQFLPAHPLHGDSARIGPVSAAPFGSGSILTISWMYMKLMGGEGLTKASEAAILNANYIAARLREHYSLVYEGRAGRIAHECILDMRPFQVSAGVSVEDIAKRLIDYGFHAPTMSFPISGTLMIEPTESESKSELDRFCDAMIHIRKEIRAIESGKLPRGKNPLTEAPHTASDLVDQNWDRQYTRNEACFPLDPLVADKYWPPVNRIDSVYGDRHLMCSCPPIDQYQERV